MKKQSQKQISEFQTLKIENQSLKQVKGGLESIIIEDHIDN